MHVSILAASAGRLAQMVRMARWWVCQVAGLIAASLVVAGCGSGAERQAPLTPTPPPAKTLEVEPANGPERTAYVQSRAGAVQLGIVVDALAEALREVEMLTQATRGVTRQALEDVASFLDSAGASLADFTVEPPPFERFEAEFAAHDERRLLALEAASDARVDMRSAITVLTDLGEVGSGPAAQVGACLADLEEAIRTLGGDPEAAP